MHMCGATRIKQLKTTLPQVMNTSQGALVIGTDSLVTGIILTVSDPLIIANTSQGALIIDTDSLVTGVHTRSPGSTNNSKHQVVHAE